MINFSAWAEIQFGGLRQKRYFDIVNLDRYDAILGIPFLKENKVLLNLAGSSSFKINSHWFPVGSMESKNSHSKEGEKAHASQISEGPSKGPTNDKSK